ncbi:heat shock protein 70 [Aphelenchoides avenae]|nr:heat shock protein 70 [Aphelenchus avenae]
MSSAFAITFGADRSWAAVVSEEGEVVVPSAQGIRSYVEFGKSEPTVGGKLKESINAANSVYGNRKNRVMPAKDKTNLGIKRLLGRKFDDPVLQQEKKFLPVDIVPGAQGRPAVKVDYYGEKRELLLEQVAAMIMVSLKEKVEQLTGGTMHEVVLTVPPCFDDAQRRALYDAASIAGLSVARLLNDTTAAAITYSRRCEDFGRSVVVIVDVGGGSTSVAVAEVSAGRVKVLSSAGSATLGVEDMDRQLRENILTELQENYKIDFNSLPEAMRRRLRRHLKTQCADVQQQLYSSTTSRLNLEINGKDVRFDICRDVFDILNEGNYDRIMAIVREALQDSHRTAASVDVVYVVGGGSRVFTLEKRISELFFGKRLVKNFHRDEAVVKGAALFASKMRATGSTESFFVEEGLGRSLSVQSSEKDDRQQVADRGRRLPLVASVTVHRNGGITTVKVYEGNIGGERQTSSFHIVGPASTEVPLQAEFRVDENGLVSMTAARQQVVDSMKPFSKASFKTKLPGKNGILSEAIGYADEWRHMFVLIEPSSGKIHEPLKANKTLETTLDGQTEVEIQVYRGNGIWVKPGNLVGTLTVPVPEAPRGVSKADLTLSIDRDLVMTAFAVAQPCAKVIELNVVGHPWKIQQKTLEGMKKDREEKQRSSKAKEALEQYCHELGGIIEEIQANKTTGSCGPLTRRRQEVFDMLEGGTLLGADHYVELQESLTKLHADAVAGTSASVDASADGENRGTRRTRSNRQTRRNNFSSVLGALKNAIVPFSNRNDDSANN